ncbi:MAG: hypothetical protein K0R82_316 [Flavipsychrobacter sp.]|nr:hypothetical protein [Flavipsychrobacter sp.]
MIAASNTAPATMSLMVLTAGLYSVVIRLQTFSIAEFTISRHKTRAIQPSTSTHSTAVIPKKKPAAIISDVIQKIWHGHKETT